MISDHFSFSCFYFLHIAHNFFVVSIFGSNKYNRQVFHLPGQSVHVSFLQQDNLRHVYKKSLLVLMRLQVLPGNYNHGRGKENHWHLYIFPQCFLSCRCFSKPSAHFFRNFMQFVQQVHISFIGDSSFFISDLQSDHGQAPPSCAVNALVACNTNFWSGMCISTGM